jgi:hypothetical protein
VIEREVVPRELSDQLDVRGPEDGPVDGPAQLRQRVALIDRHPGCTRLRHDTLRDRSSLVRRNDDARTLQRVLQDRFG